MSKPTIQASPELIAERERCAAVRRDLESFDRRTAEMEDRIANLTGTITKMNDEYATNRASQLAAAASGEVYPAPTFDQELHDQLCAQRDALKERLTRSFAGHHDRNAERRALQQRVHDAARRVVEAEAEHAIASDLAALETLRSFASKVAPDQRAEFENFSVARKGDEVTFTVKLAAASRKARVA